MKKKNIQFLLHSLDKFLKNCIIYHFKQIYYNTSFKNALYLNSNFILLKKQV